MSSRTIFILAAVGLLYVAWIRDDLAAGYVALINLARKRI
jgi:hypothetical protein